MVRKYSVVNGVVEAVGVVISSVVDGSAELLSFQAKQAAEHAKHLARFAEEAAAEAKRLARIKQLLFERKVTYKQGMQNAKKDVELYNICMNRVRKINEELEVLYGMS